MKHSRRGMTLVELLVVISIIGMLLALLLPAIQASRESGRRNTCLNNLKQLSLAMQLHETAQRRFPAGGWGFGWVGDPDRGSGPEQPGCWIFSLLPYLERPDLARMGRGLPPAQKQVAITELCQRAQAIFQCPSRRALDLYPFQLPFPPVNVNIVAAVAKSDYAVNGGDLLIGSGMGPASLAQGDSASYVWPDFSQATGVSYLRSMVTLAHIKDGTSLTYLLGEKRVASDGYDPGDDQSMYAGYDSDNTRWTSVAFAPRQDGNQALMERFGSSHADSFHMSFCDGSARSIRYDISPEVHRRLGNRQDQRLVDDKDF